MFYKEIDICILDRRAYHQLCEPTIDATCSIDTNAPYLIDPNVEMHISARPRGRNAPYLIDPTVEMHHI